MEIVTHVLTSEQHLDDTRKATARKNIAAVSGAKVKGELELLPVDENGIIEIPSDTVVGEGTLTITDGNVVLGQFGANQTTDTAVDIGGKADKVTGAANGNFAGLDANGNLTDSGKSVDDFKTKQSPISFSGDTTKTVKNISQNANGELRVEFEDIDLPHEVPNVEITSPNGTIDVHSSTDVQTNTKTFTIDVEQLQAQFPLDISDNIISQKLFVTPEMYGAKGDNTTDDTQAWQSMIADTSDAAKCIILPNNKRYKIDFWNFTLSNRTIIGVNKNNCGIKQKNSNIPFCTIGEHGRLGNITAVIGNNTTATAFINYGLNSSNAFQPFIGSYVHDIHAYCTNKVIGIDFLFPSSGSYNGVIERVKFDAPYDGIRIASTNESTPISTISFITDMAFRDILISDPYHCGYNFYKTQTGGKTISHNTFVNCSVQLRRANTYGWILPQMQAVIINPTCFLESGIGNNSAYSMKLDMIKEYPTNFVGGQIHIVGGILEGMIENKEFLDYITLDNVELVEEPTFGYLDSQERIKRYHNTNDVIKYDLDNYYHNMLNATVTNGSSVLDKSEYGYNLKLSSSSTNTSWTTIDIKLDIHGSISDYITVNSIFSLSNQYTFRLDQSIPFMWVSDGSNSVYSVLGQSRRGSYGKLTMNKEENYYIACDWFNISTLNKDELTLHISIPTLYISNISTDFVRLFGIGVYENYKYKAAELTEIDRISKYDVNCVAVNLVQNFTDAEKAQARANIGATYSIYPSLQDAISDSSNLSVGDIFETNGFHSSGDGGAARYIVSDTGTANGMDIVQLTAGKLAVLQYFNSVSTFDSAVTGSDYRLHATESANTRIADDGSATPENGYTLYRFNNLTPGSLIVVHTDDQCVFSTGASASTRIGSVLKSGPHIVVAGATWLLCSASQQFGIPKVILLNNSAGQQFAELSFGYYRDAPIYNTSVGSGLDDYGSVTTDASKTITRVNNLNEGDTVLISTDDKFIFSASASGSDRVGYPRRSGVYRVPSGVSWLLVCASSSLAPTVRVIDNSTELADYGLRIQQSSSTCTRLGKAGNLSFSLNSARTAVSDFDTHYPWNAIRECNISVDPETGMRTVVYKGETGFSYNSNTFVEIPKFYFKRVVKNGYEDWYISNHPGDGFNLEPWFRDENGNELSVRYVGKYCISDGGLSTHGQPTTVQTKSYFKNLCEQDGFSLMNMHAYQALQHLCLIELGTKNSQEIFPGVSYYKYLGSTTNQIISSSGSTNTCRIATGDVTNTYFAVGDQVAIFPTVSEDWSTAELRTLTAFSVQETYIEFTFDGSPITLTEGVSRIFGVMQKNGRCDAINKTGMLASGNTHTRPFVYRGIENLYGNLGEFVDGITYDFTSKRLCIGSEYLTFETPINSNYIDSPNPGYIYSMGVDPNKPTVTMPKTLSVNPTSGYCDEWSTFGSGLAGDVVYGCAWDHMGGNGLFCFRALTAGTNNRLYTGRAML